MLVTETTGIKLLPKIIVLNPKDGNLYDLMVDRA